MSERRVTESTWDKYKSSNILIASIFLPKSQTHELKLQSTTNVLPFSTKVVRLHRHLDI